ncbi:MAG: hypothetical protein QM496_11405 [Verrucomicrobiota bacterium]
MDTKKLAASYAKTIRWSEEDNAYIGSVHDLVGDCCHGNDPIEVYRECEEIAIECVESAAQISRKLPTPISPATSPDPIAIRHMLKMTQTKFASFLRISPKTLHKWEHGTSKPSGAARSLLKIVLEVLG